MLERYVRYMKLERNASKNTLLAYQHDLSYLTTYCHQKEIRLVDMRLRGYVGERKGFSVRAQFEHAF